MATALKVPLSCPFVTGARGDIFTVPAEHGPTRNLTHSSTAHDKAARWSPDGRRIAFISDMSGEEELYLIDQDGSGQPERLTTDGTMMRYAPVWSPDGREIAFYTMDSVSTRQIWVMPAAGGAPVQLTSGPELKNLPRWRPDGLALTYSMTAGLETRPWIITRDSAGSAWHAPRRLTAFPANVMDWTPDGRSFVSSAVAADFVDVAADGAATPREWPAARALQLDRGAPLRFSRDGRTVFGVGSHPDGRRGIWAIPVAGAAPPRLVVAFDDPAVVPLLGTGNLLTVGPDHLYISVAEYESDIWVATLRR